MLNLLKYLVLPPVINALLIAVGSLLCIRSHRRLGITLWSIGLLSLLLLSLPVTSAWLHSGLQQHPPPTGKDIRRAQAIVILGGGRDYGAPEFGAEDAPGNATWRRLAYGAHLARQSGLPILVSGGRVHGELHSEAWLMDQALRHSFGLEAQWREEHSRTTRENARYSASILQNADITHILLVTQAWHLPRALPEFRRQGLEVIPAPTDFASPPPGGIIAWIPRAHHLERSTQAIHEWLGKAVYRLLGSS